MSGEEFFVDKIKEGLRLKREKLSPEEEKILMMPMQDFVSKNKLSPQEAQALNNKCIKALEVIYEQETSGRNKNIALVWAEYNKMVYETSQRVISGIIQNWYFSVGRKQEKKAVGCFPLILLAIGIATSLVLLIIFVVGI